MATRFCSHSPSEVLKLGLELLGGLEIGRKNQLADGMKELGTAEDEFLIQIDELLLEYV